MMLSEKTFKSWRIDFGEKVTSSAEAMLKRQIQIKPQIQILFVSFFNKTL